MFVLNERLHTRPDFIARSPHAFDRLSFRICQRPVIAAKTGNVWAFVSATHRDEHLGVLGQFSRKLLWPGSTQIDPDLPHRLYDYGMDPIRRMGSGGNGTRRVWIYELVKKCCGHLRTASVMNAGKDKRFQWLTAPLSRGFRVIIRSSKTIEPLLQRIHRL